MTCADTDAQVSPVTSTLAIAFSLVLSATGLPAIAFAQPSGAAFPAKPLRII